MIVKVKRYSDGKIFFASKIEFMCCGTIYISCHHWPGQHKHGFNCRIVGLETRSKPLQCNYTAQRDIHDATGHYDRTVKVCSSCGEEKKH